MTRLAFLARRITPAQRDIALTYVAQAWVAVMGIAFVPVYIRYLGIESYGVIGLFATLQAILVILDLGMTQTLLREMSRFVGGERDVVGIRDLLRSVEVAAFAMAALMAGGLWAASDWLAESWFRTQSVSTPELARALSVMSVLVALRFVEGIFRGAIQGLDRQLLLNLLNALFATLRAAGAVAVLAYVSRSLDGFFAWQALVSLITTAAFAAATYASLPRGERPGRFSYPALVSIWRFAAGMLVISVLALLLTQVDKLLLSRLLTLTDYGYYMLATVVAGSLGLLIGPIFQILTPRLSRLHAAGDEAAFSGLYHASAQLVSVVAGAAACVLIAFADVLLSAWMGDPALAARTAPLLQVLALGNLLNMLVWTPYQAQLAYRWTGLMVRINLVAVLLIVPLLLWVVPHFGMIGAAWVWVALNAGYIIVAVQMMHRRILRGEELRWYVQDVGVPLACAAAAAMALRWLLAPLGNDTIGQIASLVFASALTLAVAVAVAPLVREQALRLLFGPSQRSI
jgi:O-antigen/teichoic acid export membrane protein